MRTIFLAKIFALVFASFIGCDMTHITADNSNEQGQLAQEGAALRITGLPHNLQAHNILRIGAANTVSTVARIDPSRPILITGDEFYSTAYIPLVNSGGQTFNENGSLFVIVDIAVDALNRVVFERDDGVLVNFFNGRGELDINNIPPPYIPLDGRRFLTITGLPSHVQPGNISNVAVWNQAGRIGRGADGAIVQVSGELASISVPLVYDGSSEIFAETGYFFVSFDLNVDALNRIHVMRDDAVLVNFSSGRGEIHAESIRFLEPPDMRTFLAISGLPSHVQQGNISNVAIWNQGGVIGRLREGTETRIRVWGDFATMYVPLTYAASGDGIFSQTGAFFVSFQIDVDALTRIEVLRTDNVLVNFFGGNAALDISTLPERTEPVVPVLTIEGLPSNTTTGNFSNVFVYNMAGRVARAVYSDITIEPNVSAGIHTATARIPLVNINGSEQFRNSGLFIVTFSVNVDAQTQIIRDTEFGLSVQFDGGFALVALASSFGYFSGGLANPHDVSPPVIRAGTRLEINRSIATVWVDTPVRRDGAITRSSMAFVYAIPNSWGVEFVYSAAVPVFDPVRNGYYSGNRRALFKFIFLRDASTQYVAKTLITEPWPSFHYHTVMANTPQSLTSSGAVEGLHEHLHMSGLGNPALAERTLPPGAYIFVLRGAGGGQSGHRSSSPALPGGVGGFVSELVILGSDTSFNIFTGQGGNSAEDGQGGSGNSGGGGGSGSSMFILPSEALPDGYLLTAGGGGGAAGARVHAGSTAGGGGGGGRGGASGPGGHGGQGGLGDQVGARVGRRGEGGGRRGIGTNGEALPVLTLRHSIAAGGSGWGASFISGGNGGNGGGVAIHEYGLSSSFADNPNVSGRGGNSNGTSGEAGQPGGNSRNATRGGGGQGSNSTARGGDGSITVYRIASF